MLVSENIEGIYIEIVKQEEALVRISCEVLRSSIFNDSKMLRCSYRIARRNKQSYTYVVRGAHEDIQKDLNELQRVGKVTLLRYYGKVIQEKRIIIAPIN